MKLFRHLILVFFITLSARALAADAISEMAEFSVFGKINLAELADGQVKTASGALMSTERYLSVQSCFVVPKPPAQVMAAMKQFDPTAQRDLKVYLHSDLPATPSASNFSKLSNPPGNSAVKALTAATEKMSPELQLSRAEAQKFSAWPASFCFLDRRAHATRAELRQRWRCRPGAL